MPTYPYTTVFELKFMFQSHDTYALFMSSTNIGRLKYIRSLKWFEIIKAIGVSYLGPSFILEHSSRFSLELVPSFGYNHVRPKSRLT